MNQARKKTKLGRLGRICANLLAGATLLVLAGCAAQVVEQMEYVEVEKEVPAVADSGGWYDADEAIVEEVVSGAAAGLEVQERLIIRNATLSVVVEDTEAFVDTIEGLVNSLEGWVVNANIWEYSGVKRGNINVRVPVEKLDAFLDELALQVNEVTSKSISGQDVTEEFVDLQAQLDNLQATADRVRSFLDDARKVEEALAVNAELSRLEGEIERITGRMKYLEGSARFSSVSVEITPDELAQPVQIGGWQPQGTARDALQALIKTLQWIVDVLIFLVIYLLPVLLIIVGPIYLLVRFWLKRRKRRAAARSEGAQTGADD